ncbi:diguanylate cyclase [Lacimicrobium sp. SS2-24]|uniref:diguanylate cyclase n=1 Tax=Lacimicrobium sp. SS2-24 TaxID=2005569 RepID=UPI000B4BCEA7|nr:diguanylate cyclase [Lacimicrobium sp. SS2-24]
MTKSAPSDTVEHQLAQLSQRFIQRSERELGEYCDKVSQLDEKHSNWPFIEELHQFLHRLTGSAGTFGLPEFSQQCRELEKRVKDYLQHADDPQTGWSTVMSKLHHDVQPVLQQLPSHLVLTTHAVPHGLTRADTHDDPVVVALVEHPGGFIDALQEELRHFGFTLLRVKKPKALQHQLDTTTSAVIIITHASLASDSLAIKQHLHRSAPQRTIATVCFGTYPDFDSRYRLAAMGIDGLFADSTHVSDVAEYLQRLQSEHLQAVEGKVLIVDDDAQLLEHYSLVLSTTGIEVKTLSKPERIFSLLSEFQPDILLLDVHMHAYFGPTLARMIRFQPEWLSLPIIYLSAEQDKTAQMKALASGADEFISKPISDMELKETVITRCFRARQLAGLLARDSLTGLLKHSLIKQEIANEHTRCQRLKERATVVMLDIDHFKKVNDNYGHSTGDMVIKALANLLKHRLRKTDKIGRYGGEEFAVVMPQCELRQAQQILEEIRIHFAELVFHCAELEFHVTLSAGIAQLEAYANADAALEAADKALYERKQQGRNGITLAQVDAQG